MGQVRRWTFDDKLYAILREGYPARLYQSEPRMASIRASTATRLGGTEGEEEESEKLELKIRRRRRIVEAAN
jgi:hypothetical protein